MASYIQPPPVYQAYPTQLPELFRVVYVNTAPLVNVMELQAHLVLLGAFDRLKAEVQNQPTGVAVYDKELAWVVYVARAARRFEVYLNGPYPDVRITREANVPPLDVLMVWHSYLLVSFCTFQ